MRRKRVGLLQSSQFSPLVFLPLCPNYAPYRKFYFIEFVQNSLHCKGQIISKHLFGVLNFFQKTNENKLYSSKNEFVCSFFGRIQDTIICFRGYLTFNMGVIIFDLWGHGLLESQNGTASAHLALNSTFSSSHSHISNSRDRTKGLDFYFQISAAYSFPWRMSAI